MRLNQIILYGFSLIFLLMVGIGCQRGHTFEKPSIKFMQQNMLKQQKYRPQAESHFFVDKATMRTTVEGTIAQGQFWQNPAYFTGRTEADSLVPKSLEEVNEQSLARGKNRFNIYCVPCHDADGIGNGLIVQRSADYQITTDFFTNLESDTIPIPQEIMDQLKTLEGQKYAEEEEFLRALRGKLGEEAAATYQLSFLKHVTRGYIPPPTYHSDQLRQIEDGYFFEVITNGVRSMPSYAHQVNVEDRWHVANYIRLLQQEQMNDQN